MSHRGILFAAALFFSGSAILPAGSFNLIESRTKSEQSSFVVNYEPEPKAPRPLDSMPVSFDPVRDEDLLLGGIAPRRAEPPTAFGALLVLPGIPSGADIRATSSGRDVSSAVSFQLARIGTINAIRIAVDETQLPSHIKPVEITIDVAVKPARPGVALSSLPASQRLLPSLFLNGKDLHRVQVNSQSETKTLSYPPAPPGDFRITYEHGNEVLLVPLNGLGITVGEAGQLAVLHHGNRLPIGGTIGTSVWFYAPRRQTLTDRNDSVFATPGAAVPSAAMVTRAAFLTLAPQGSEVSMPRTHLYAPNLRYERSSVQPIGERFVIHQIRLPFAASTPPDRETVNLEVPDFVTSNDVTVEVSIVGLTETSQSTDHYSEFTLGGVTAPALQWDGRIVYTDSFDLTLASIPGTTMWPLEHRIPGLPPLVQADRQDLEFVRLTWQGKPRLNSRGEAIIDVPSGGTPVRITAGGFPPDSVAAGIVLLDITNPAAPVRLTGFPLFADGTGGRAIEFEASAAGGRFYTAVLADRAAPGEVVAAESLPALPAGRLERLYVRPPALSAALQPLITLRGASTTVSLDPQAAYNVFNGGQQDPEALRLALASVISSAPERLPLPTVLLVAHGSLDPRNYLGLQSGAQIPPYVEESVPTTGYVTIESPVDLPYALLEGADYLPDVRLGRLTVRTPAELTTVVDRILAQDAAKESLRSERRPGLLVTDNDSEFLADAAIWPALWTQAGHPAIQYDLPPAPMTSGQMQAARNEVKDYFESAPAGLAFALYTGHGNTDRWADESIVNVAAVPGIDTEGKWPIIATFTCLTGYYAFPGGSISLSEAWLLEPGRGAAVNIAPTSLELYLEQSLFCEKMMDAIALPPTLRPADAGGIMAKAEIDFLAAYPALASTARVFLLFGDPESDFTLSSDSSSTVERWILF